MGEITNLMSVDGQRLMDLVPYLYAIVSCKFVIVVCYYNLKKNFFSDFLY